MALTLNAIDVRHERRVRLVFSGAVAAGALAPTKYAVTGQDGAASPPVVGALLVPGAPSCVELALGADLAAGILYALDARAVPALDGTVTPPGASLRFRWDSGDASPNTELPADDLEALLYGVDLVWTGADFAETPLGDLATVQGAHNVKGALERRLASEEDLPWRRGRYGPGARSFVDGPRTDATTLRGAILRQASGDDRVKRVTATFAFDETGSGDAYFDVAISLVGAEDFALRLPVTRG